MIVRTHVVYLPDGSEALTIFERRGLRDSESTYSVVYPSRRIDPATPEKLKEYADCWAEAVAWLQAQP